MANGTIIGSSTVSSYKLGSNTVSAIYLGSNAIYLPKLSTPRLSAVISGSNTMLYWTSITNAVSYTLYKDGSVLDTTTSTEYYIYERGDYQVKANGDGTTYYDSDLSNISSQASVWFTIEPTFDSTYVEESSSNPSRISDNGTATLTFYAKNGSSFSANIHPTVEYTTFVSWTVSTTTTTNDTGVLVIQGHVNYPTSGTNGVVYANIVNLPVVGQLITMNLGNSTPLSGTQHQYRVLSISGDEAEVVAMYAASQCDYNSSGTNTYSGGELDTMLNTTFYGSLSSTAKSAIVPKTITSYEYAYDSSVYDSTTHASYADYSTKAIHENIGSRNVYALDVEDVENYFNNTFSTENIWTLFYKTTSEPSPYPRPWLRSTVSSMSDCAWEVDGKVGRIWYDYVNYANYLFPALTIDLSEISWNTEDEFDVSGHAWHGFIGSSSWHSGTLEIGSSVTLNISPSTGYKLPDEVSGGLPSNWICTNATMTYSKTSDSAGTITISNPCGDVSFVIWMAES